jgi:hypothetical protein
MRGSFIGYARRPVRRVVKQLGNIVNPSAIVQVKNTKPRYLDDVY